MTKEDQLIINEIAKAITTPFDAERDQRHASVRKSISVLRGEPKERRSLACIAMASTMGDSPSFCATLLEMLCEAEDVVSRTE